jgi:tetratricopeptide (TPR) repeat protein
MAMSLRHVILIAISLCVTVPAASVRARQACTSDQGQRFIDEGRYKQAIKEFTCVIDAQPTEVEGYRGRAEAQVMLGRYSDAMRDYGLVTAVVLPVHPDAVTVIFEGYDARLSVDPQSLSALTGASFARWWDFQYGKAIHLLDRLLASYPDSVYGPLFRGSSRLLYGATTQGVADLDRALALAPQSPDVHWIVADAYTYGLPDPQRAFDEATAALKGGLDTPRVHAILGASYLAFGNMPAAAQHIKRHIDLVTTALVPTVPMGAGDSFALAVAPGRVYEIPIPAVAGETIAITTSSKDYWDTIAVLLAPDGTPVIASDDANAYFAAFEWPAAQTATYRLRVTFFEAINTGVLKVTRD